MISYRILSYRDTNGAPRAGILIDGLIYPAATLLEDDRIDASSVLGLLQSWERLGERLSERLAQPPPRDGALALKEATLLAPILYPGALFCTWGNYRDHLQEMAKLAGRTDPLPEKSPEPFFVTKTSAHSVIGNGEPIHYPAFSTQLDWEAEIGVVIGRTVFHATEQNAMAAVAGYTIVNDLSARDAGRRKEPNMAHLLDWYAMKSFRDSAPMGPWITPAAFIADPYALDIKLWVNGELRQSGNSRSMVYSIPELIVYLSRHMPLRPGDVLVTGCPAGVGMSSGRFLQVGDAIRIEVSGCGVLENTVVAG